MHILLAPNVSKLNSAPTCAPQIPAVAHRANLIGTNLMTKPAKPAQSQVLSTSYQILFTIWTATNEFLTTYH